jgi:methionine synthase I (cobalamin-dependent)
MHTKLPLMVPALQALARAWKGPRMAYAETGHASAYLWHFDDRSDAEAYARHARTWVEELGVQVVGGCCGTGPEHISQVSRMLRGLERRSPPG